MEGSDLGNRGRRVEASIEGWEIREKKIEGKEGREETGLIGLSGRWGGEGRGGKRQDLISALKTVRWRPWHWAFGQGDKARGRRQAFPSNPSVNAWIRHCICTGTRVQFIRYTAVKRQLVYACTDRVLCLRCGFYADNCLYAHEFLDGNISIVVYTVSRDEFISIQNNGSLIAWMFVFHLSLAGYSTTLLPQLSISLLFIAPRTNTHSFVN